MRRLPIKTQTSGALHVGYARVSTHQQASEGLSLDAQRSRLESAATLRGVTLEIFSDEESGKDTNRPHFLSLLTKVKAGQIASVTVCKLDRLTRSVRDLLDLMTLFEAHGVAFISLAETIDTTTAMGRFFTVVLGAIAELERGLISDRTTAVLRHKRASGLAWNHAPYGFDKSDGRLMLNESELAVAHRILQARVDGQSFGAIAKQLNAESVPAKMGGPWYPSTVSFVCGNRDLYVSVSNLPQPSVAV
jgi:site-specific DNA recombinase